MQSQRKTIAFVANTTWNIFNFRLNIIRALVDKGYRVVVIAPVDAYIRYLDQIEGVVHIELPNLKRKSINPLQDLRLLYRFLQIYKRVQPDLVFHYTIKPNIFGNLAAGILGIKSYGVITGLGYSFLHKGFLNKITSRLYRFSLHYADNVLFENQEDLQLFQDLQIIPKNKGLHINGCGVDPGRFRPMSSRTTSSSNIYLFIGRLLYDKGIREFVEAAHYVQKSTANTECWVLGEVDEENPSAIPKDVLLEWIDSGVIRYFGTSDDVRQVIREVDCVVLPSYREGLSKVLLEALAMGKPIITTDTAGCRETVLHGKNGFLVPVQDADALALAMDTFALLSREERRAMGQHSRKLALERYTDKLVVRQYMHVIDPQLQSHLLNSSSDKVV